MFDLGDLGVYERVFGDLWENETWVCWRLKDGTKRPHNPHDPIGRHASSTDSITWGDGKSAWMQAHAGPHPYNGVGYVFTETGPLIGIDIDKCRNPKTADIEPWAREIIDRIGSYTEVSPSGTGVHIYVRSDRPLSELSETVDRLEVYSRARFFCTTCNRFELSLGEDEINESPDGIGWLIDTYLEEKTTFKEIDEIASPHIEGVDSFISPDTWVEKALEHIDPDIGYDDWLAVGMALHSEYNGDERGLEIFDEWSSGGDKYGGSGDIRKKWQSFRGGDGGYSGATIWRAAKVNGWQFDPDIDSDALDRAMEDISNRGGVIEADTPNDTADDKEAADQRDDTDMQDSARVDSKVDEEPSHRSLTWHSYGSIIDDDSAFDPYYVEPGLIGHGDTAMIFSPPKTMKSMAVLDQCAHWACGKEWLDFKPSRPLNIAFLNFELKYDSLRRRRQLLGHGDFTREEIQMLEKNLLVSDRYTPGVSNYNELIIEIYKSIKRVKSKKSWDLLVIDPIVNAFMGEENANSEVMDFLSSLRQLADALDPTCALYLVHHTSKMSRDERKEEPFRALRGGSAFRGAYDTGIALTWDSADKERLRMAFECRNSKGIDDRTLKFDDGNFVHLSGGDGDSLPGTESQSGGKEAQFRTICRTIDKRARQGKIYTKHSFAKTFENVSCLPSSRTLSRRLDTLIHRNILGFFDASKYDDALDPPSGRSNGYLCTSHTEIYYNEDSYGSRTIQPESNADMQCSEDLVDRAHAQGQIMDADSDHFDGLIPVDTLY